MRSPQQRWHWTSRTRPWWWWWWWWDDDDDDTVTIDVLTGGALVENGVPRVAHTAVTDDDAWRRARATNWRLRYPFHRLFVHGETWWHDRHVMTRHARLHSDRYERILHPNISFITIQWQGLPNYQRVEFVIDANKLGRQLTRATDR